jgi:cytochrome P450
MQELHLRSDLAVAIAFLIPALFLWRLLNNVFLSPLRSIPGPFLAKLTGEWLIFVDFAGSRTSTIHKLHQKYGTAVRVGPTEVSFSNIESVKDIYGQQTAFMKAPIYDKMSLPPLGIFSLRDRVEHTQRRKLLSHAFSQSALNDTEPTIHTLIEKLVGRVKRNLGKPLNMLLWFRCLSLDIVGMENRSDTCFLINFL